MKLCGGIESAITGLTKGLGLSSWETPRERASETVGLGTFAFAEELASRGLVRLEELASRGLVRLKVLASRGLVRFEEWASRGLFRFEELVALSAEESGERSSSKDRRSSTTTIFDYLLPLALSRRKLEEDSLRTPQKSLYLSLTSHSGDAEEVSMGEGIRRSNNSRCNDMDGIYVLVPGETKISR